MGNTSCHGEVKFDNILYDVIAQEKISVPDDVLLTVLLQISGAIYPRDIPRILLNVEVAINVCFRLTMESKSATLTVMSANVPLTSKLAGLKSQCIKPCECR